MSAYSFGVLEGHGASGCTLPDPGAAAQTVVGVCAHCGDYVYDSDDMVYDTSMDEWFCDADCYFNEQKKRGAVLEGERWPPEYA